MATLVYTPTTPTPLERIDRLLRDRPAFLEHLLKGEQLLETTRTMILCTALCTALFGAVLGSFRGGSQIAFAALKLPLVTLFTAALVAPAIPALHRILHRPSDLRRDIALLTTAFALASILLAALAPLLLFAIMIGLNYHLLILLTVALCAASGVAGLHLLWQGLSRSDTRHTHAAGAVVVLLIALVGSQLAWTLRPYLVRPRTPEPPIVRHLEGSFVEAIAHSTRSLVLGSTRRAPLPGDAR